jgi:hypothetical protein
VDIIVGGTWNGEQTIDMSELDVDYRGCNGGLGGFPLKLPVVMFTGHPQNMLRFISIIGKKFSTDWVFNLESQNQEATFLVDHLRP